MMYKSMKELSPFQKRMFVKAFSFMKSKYTPENIMQIDKYVIKEHEWGIGFCFNYTSKKDKQTVQSTEYLISESEKITFEIEKKQTILNKKLKKIRLS